MIKSPLVSAIIVTHNGKNWLGRSLPSLIAQTYRRMEIVVVDNASTDGTVEFVEEKFPIVKIVRLSKNRGFSVGNNEGAKVSKGEYLFIGNDDLVLDKKYVEKLIEVMEDDKTIGASQGTIYSYGKRSEIQSAGKFFNYSGVLFGDMDRLSPVKRDPVEIFYANAPLVRRKAFDKVGGFDEDFFIYFEETDLCWRMWLAGFRVVYVPKAKMYHKGGATTAKMSGALILKTSIGNRISSFLKNLSWGRLFIGVAVQLFVTMVGALNFLIRRKNKYFLAVIQAWIWNLWHLPNTLAKRISIQRNRVISDRELFRRVGAGFPLSELVRKVG